MTVYKIRHKETGLYSRGGIYGMQWSKTGKTWSHIARVKSHLRQAIRHGLSEQIGNWEIIELVTEEKVIDPSQFLKS